MSGNDSEIRALFRCRVRVFGSVFISFPAKALPYLIDDESADAPTADDHLRTPLTFELINAERVNALIPNRQVLSSDALSAFKSAPVHAFEFGRAALADYLRRERLAKPSAPYHNVEVLRYEVRAPQPLLEVQVRLTANMCNSYFAGLLENGADANRSARRLRAQHAVDHRRRCAAQRGIHDGDHRRCHRRAVAAGREMVRSRPQRVHIVITCRQKQQPQLQWHMTELSPHGSDASGSLKARVMLDTGPSPPAAVHVRFAVADATVSGAGIHLTNDAYRMSLLKRKIVTGKYFADPLTRQ